MRQGISRELRLRLAVLAACAVAASAMAGGDLIVVQLSASKDNSLVEIDDGSLSLAVSEFIFAGRVGNHGGNAKLRRGLIWFDVVAALPPGCTVISVELAMFCVMTNSGPHSVELRRVLEGWGEGTSSAVGGAGAPATPGDATWLHAFWPDQFWSIVGGTFADIPSGVAEVAFPGPYVWSSSPGMVADVQTWLDQPSGNFGWLVLGDEPYVQSVKAFASRENIVVEQRPVLTVTYQRAAVPSPDIDGDGVVGGGDLGILLSAWDTPNVVADLDGDGAVGGSDLGLLLASWTS